jgi:hypothetical protein
MSLDVELRLEGHYSSSRNRIYVRVDGATKEISLDEWNQLHLDETPLVLATGTEDDVVYRGNITHNLTDMASHVILSNGEELYVYLWHPDKHNITKAKELIVPLAEGFSHLINNEVKYKKFNPPNGWGNYKGFVGFIREYLSACIKYPEAIVQTDI